MEYKMVNEELEKHQEKMAHQRRVYAQARAIIQRGKDAGIPEKYLRIPKDEFQELLCPQYHGNVEQFANTVYGNPKVLFEKSFVVIDGGDMYARKKAGFAILFRMIACDKRGKYHDCGQLSTEFESIKFDKESNRNKVVREAKNEGILFINEFHKKKFKINFDASNFFDQLLEFRDDYSKPTIITFTNPLQSRQANNGNAIMDDRCGSYLAMISQADMRNNKNVFRIKVK